MKHSGKSTKREKTCLQWEHVSIVTWEELSLLMQQGDQSHTVLWGAFAKMIDPGVYPASSQKS